MEKHFLCLVDVFLSVDVIVIQTFHIKYLYVYLEHDKDGGWVQEGE